MICHVGVSSGCIRLRRCTHGPEPIVETRQKQPGRAGRRARWTDDAGTFAADESKPDKVAVLAWSPVDNVQEDRRSGGVVGCKHAPVWEQGLLGGRHARCQAHAQKLRTREATFFDSGNALVALLLAKLVPGPGRADDDVRVRPNRREWRGRWCRKCRRLRRRRNQRRREGRWWHGRRQGR